MENLKIDYLALSQIEPSKTNPRKTFNQVEIKELAESINEKGVLQPIIVREIKKDKYEIVAGERRFRAACIAFTLKKGKIPAIVRELKDDEVLEIQIIENLQRKDVHPVEEAEGFLHLHTTQKFDVKEIAQRVGKSAAYVQARIKLNSLIEPIKTAFFENKILLTHAVKIAALAADAQQEFFENEIEHLDEGELYDFHEYSYKQYQGDLSQVKFSLEDPNLNPAAGACIGCQYNTSTLLFFDDGKGARCTNVGCLTTKNQNYILQLVTLPENQNLILISSKYSPDKKEFDYLNREVLTNYDYDIVVPEEPMRDDFDDDEEGENDYKTELKEYKKKLGEFNKSVKLLVYQKALIVDGESAGQQTYIELRKRHKTTSEAPKTSENKKAAKLEKLNNQLKNLESDLAEARFEKVVDLVINKYKSNKVNKLSFDEKKAFILLLVESMGFDGGDIVEALGFDSIGELSQIEIIDDKTIAKLAIAFILSTLENNSFQQLENCTHNQVEKLVEQSKEFKAIEPDPEIEIKIQDIKNQIAKLTK